MNRVAINPKNVFNPQTSGRHNDPQGVPWSHAIKASGTFLFVSGQTAADLKGGILSPGDIYKQTEIALENLRKVIKAAGFEMRNVVQLMWFVTDSKKFYSTGASALRRKYFERDSYPASTLVEIRRLADPKAMVEVQAVAVANK
jgi:2-iminobutanoate/2-iminopropanoate deaminase